MASGDEAVRGRTAAARRIMSTLHAGYGPRWSRVVDSEPCDAPGTVADLRSLLRRARDKDVVVLLGAVGLRHRYRDLVFAALVQHLPGRRPRILITDATWEPRSRSLGRRTGLPAGIFGLPIRAAVSLIDGPNVRYCVLSTDELTTFPRTWGVDPDRVVYTPFPATIREDTPHRLGDYAFAGGNSLRDQGTLARALRAAGVPAVVATAAPDPGLPGEVSWGPLPQADYDRAMADCGVAVICLEPSVRSAGQQTYLNAMLLEKPVVVTDAPGVRDSIEDGVTGVIVPARDHVAVGEAVRAALDPARRAEFAAMGARARRAVLERRLDFRTYFDETLLAAAEWEPPTPARV